MCAERIEKHKLDMKLVDVEYTLDRSKILFYFTADGRVDFRDLVKDLAGVFHTRIEPVSYTHLDVYKRQMHTSATGRSTG